MKLSTKLTFGALFVLSSAMPLEKRQDVTITTTIDVIETIEAVVTVWLPPGAKQAVQDLHKQVAQPVQPNPAPAAHITPVQDAVVPASSSPSASSPPSASNSPSVAPQDSPQAAQDQVNNAQDQANYAQDLKNKAQKDQDLADQQQSIDTQNQINKAQDQANNAKTAQNQAVPAPVAQPPAAPVNAPAAAPVKSSPAPAATQDKASSGQTQATSGGSCGEIGGSCKAADVTFFDGGLGACGWTNDTASEDFFALAADTMGGESNGSPFCGRTAAIVYQGKTIHGTLTDKCPGCSGQSLDLSRHLFDQLFVESEGRYHDIDWHFTS